MVKLLKEDADAFAAVNADPKLRNWDKKFTPLLDHKKVKRLISLIPKTNDKLRDYVEKYLDDLMAFVNARAAYEQELGWLREEFRFKLFLLKALRNDIAHGGEHEHPTFLLYSDELQDVLEKLLESIGNAIITNSAKFKTVDEVIKEIEVWWIR